jgi:hypothetical protein
MRFATIAAALLLATTAFDVSSQEMSSFDRERLARFEQAKAAAMDQASEATMEERAAIDSVMMPSAGPVSEQALMGEWRCRIMKVGGLAPAKVYDWFACRISETGTGLYFEKLGGSQRIAGGLGRYSEEAYLLLGATSVADEPQPTYSGHRPGAGAAASSRDQIGVLSMIGEDRARIEFPYPAIESTFDIIEMQR